MKIFLTLILAFLLSSCGSGRDDNSSDTTQLSYTHQLQIDMRTISYDIFETTLLQDQASFEAFVLDFEAQDEWSDGSFIATLEDAQVDFDTTNLLLYRITEGSGSIELTPHEPQIEGTTMSIQIDRYVPDVGTDDMAYYCLAYLVDKNITKVVITLGDSTETITIDN